MPTPPPLRVRTQPETFAITAVTHNRHRLFQRPDLAELLLTTLFRYRDTGRFLVHGFVVMPDHTHILITPAPDHTIEHCVQLIKGGFSFAARTLHKEKIWQDGYHAHRITSPSDFQSQLLCIANNPSSKSLTNYPHVHNAHPNLIDPPPLSFANNQSAPYANSNAHTDAAKSTA